MKLFIYLKDSFFLKKVKHGDYRFYPTKILHNVFLPQNMTPRRTVGIKHSKCKNVISLSFIQDKGIYYPMSLDLVLSLNTVL